MFAPFLLRKSTTIPEQFLSFNFDWNLNRSEVDAWTNASYGFTLDLQNPRMRTLAKALAPANLRVGGSNADVAEYNEEFPGGKKCSDEAVAKKVCLTPARWDELIEFANTVGLRLVFDLNIMIGRDSGGEWDSTNAKALLTYTAKKYPSFKHGFELGNEKEFVVGPEDAAHCYLKLRGFINTLWPEESGRPILVGPELNPRPDWLRVFLDTIGVKGVLDAVAYHMYVGYGRSLNLPSLMLQPAWLDFSHTVAAQSRAAQLSSPAGRDAELWIGETAAAWASGTAGVCDGFISGFWWLDQLGMAASTGHGAMSRQCFVGGNYSLLDQLNGFKPNPDYWTAWVWRHLVSTRMVDLSQVMPYEGDYKPNARAYMACTSRKAAEYKEGAVTLIFINQDQAQNKSILMYQQDRYFGSKDPLLAYEGRAAATSAAAAGAGAGASASEWPPTPPPFPNLPRYAYVLTAPGSNVLSREVQLNGQVLKMDEAPWELPTLAGEAATSEAFVVPPSSYGFAVYPNAQAPACMGL
jgi:heparanase 1